MGSFAFVITFTCIYWIPVLYSTKAPRTMLRFALLSCAAATSRCAYVATTAGALMRPAGSLRVVQRASGRGSRAQMQSPCAIKVVGVGGGGGNAVNRMIQFGQADNDAVEYWTINTDIQALDASLSPNRLGIGAGTSRGMGAGGRPEMGRAAAEESKDQLGQMVGGADMVFVVAGMGGGTGSGAAPVVAEAAKKLGCLTVAVVTKPFSFEGQKRMKQANAAIEALARHVDAMIVVSNDRLLDLVDDGTPLQEAFCVADDILRQGVVGISDIIIKPGLINVDFADVQAVMGESGLALMGIGLAEGKDRAHDAAVAALSSPLIDFPISQVTVPASCSSCRS